MKLLPSAHIDAGMQRAITTGLFRAGLTACALHFLVRSTLRGLPTMGPALPYVLAGFGPVL